MPVGRGRGDGVDWLVIGLGNADRGDDGAGVDVARDHLAASGVQVVVHEGDGLGLIELWRGQKRVIVVDAAVGAIAPGGYARFDASAQPLPGTLAARRVHGVGLAEAVEIARALFLLPDVLVIYAIGAAAFTLGDGLTPAVAAVCAEVADRIRRDIAAS